MQNSRDYKINTFGQKDVPTAHWQWEPLKITQPFNVPLSLCCVHSETTGASASTVLILVCLPEREGRDLGVTAVTALAWVHLRRLSRKVTYLGWTTAEKLPHFIPLKPNHFRGRNAEYVEILWRKIKTEFMHLQIAFKVVTFFCLHLKTWSRSQELHYRAFPEKWGIPWFDFVFSHTLSSGEKHIILLSNPMIF